MRILIRSTIAFVVADILAGCTPEIVIKSIVLLVLLGILIKCTQAYLSTPYPAEAFALAAAPASSARPDELYQPQPALTEVIVIPYRPRISSATYSYV